MRTATSFDANGEFAAVRSRKIGRPIVGQTGICFTGQTPDDVRTEQLIRLARCEVYRQRAEAGLELFDPPLTPEDLDRGLAMLRSGSGWHLGLAATAIALAG